jgi:hypothetical protein
VTYIDLPRVLTMSAAWLLMLIWQLNAYRTGCATAIALLGVFTLLILLSGAEIALARRRTLLQECLDTPGFLYRLLSRRILLLALELLKSSALALLLFASVLGFTARQWSILFADVLVLGLLLPRFYMILKGAVREDYRFGMARRWALWVSTLLLWFESMLVLLFSAAQDYGGLRWQEVITYAASAPNAQCGWFRELGALVSAVEALGHWSVQNLARSLQDLPQALMASISLLATAGLSLVVAYAYSRALVGSVARPWTMWRLTPHAPD